MNQLPKSFSIFWRARSRYWSVPWSRGVQAVSNATTGAAVSATASTSSTDGRQGIAAQVAAEQLGASMP